MAELKNFKRDYLEEQMYFYGKGGRVRKGNNSSNVRLLEPIDAMVAFYRDDSPITRAWSTKAKFDELVKEAKRKQRY